MEDSDDKRVRIRLVAQNRAVISVVAHGGGKGGSDFMQNMKSYTTDDIMLGHPDDTTPIDYARACTLMGAAARARLFGTSDSSDDSSDPRD